MTKDSVDLNSAITGIVKQHKTEVPKTKELIRYPMEIDDKTDK